MEVNPTSPVSLAYAPIEEQEPHPRVRKSLLVLVPVTFLCVIGAWVAVIFAGAHTTPGTGPLIAAQAMAMLVLAIIGRRIDAILIATLHLLLCLLLLILTTLNNWGPSKATEPFMFIGLGYLAIALPANLITFVRLSARPRATYASSQKFNREDSSPGSTTPAPH